jgi:NTP pyrophosphatase (non-canonical NTP hydrolase)
MNDKAPEGLPIGGEESDVFEIPFDPSPDQRLLISREAAQIAAALGKLEYPRWKENPAPALPQPTVERCPANTLRRGLVKFQRELSAYLDYNQFTVNGVTDQTVGDCLALLHSEVSEALDAYRKRGFVSWTREDGKPEGFAEELADVFIRLVDTAVRYDVDLAAEVRRKMDFNWTRPARHGNPNL